MVAGDCSPTQRILDVAPGDAPPLSVLGMLQTPVVGGVPMSSGWVDSPVIDVEEEDIGALGMDRGW